MIKVAFCDDDLSVLSEISVLMDEYRVEHNQEILYAAFHSPIELLTEIEKGMSVDVLFLDIVMPAQNGISVAKEIREYDNNVKIIFLTSSSEFAVQSYAVGAYYYLLKPIGKESFWQLMDSVISECKKEQKTSLILRCKSGITRLELDSLMYCEVIGRTLFFYMAHGNALECVGSMDELCRQLIPYKNFLRPHRSFLVNMDYIQSISAKAISMTNLAVIPLPRGKYSEIKNSYLAYVFDRKQVFFYE